MFGVWFAKDAYTIHVVDDGEGAKPPDGVLRFIAIEDGRSYTESRDLDAAALRAFGHVADAKSTTRAAAPALEAADRAFAADVKARGADGWLAAFDPHGGMLRKGTRIEGDAIKGTMAGLLSDGVLAWDPIASGVEGDVGFTVGKATYTPTKPDGDHWASTYLTIWHHQPDGSWKVLFDTGRVVNR
jgi:ketosteroid isomerase-like protein